MKTTFHAWRGGPWAAGVFVLVVAGAAPARAGAYLTQDDGGGADGTRTTADRAWT